MQDLISLPEMTCQELVELVTDYFEHALAENDRARLERHLASCDGCDRYIQQMRRTIESLGALKQEHVSPEAQEKLTHVFREWRASPNQT